MLDRISKASGALKAGVRSKIDGPRFRKHGATQEDDGKSYPFDLSGLLCDFPGLILRQLEAEDISKLRLVLPESSCVAEHALRNNHDYDDAFRAFFEHSPRALQALITDSLSCLHEVLALSVSLEKYGTIPESASEAFPMSPAEVARSVTANSITDIFWMFICHYRHPIVIYVPEDALSLVKALPGKCKAFLMGRKAKHHPPIILKAKSAKFCKELQDELEDPVWQRKVNISDGAWSFPFSVSAVAEEIVIGEFLFPETYCWPALETIQERVDRLKFHRGEPPVYRRGRPGLGHMLHHMRTFPKLFFLMADIIKRSDLGLCRSYTATRAISLSISP